MLIGGFESQRVGDWQNEPQKRCNSLIMGRQNGAINITQRQGGRGRIPSHPTKTNRTPNLLYTHAKLENLGNYERTKETTR